MKQLLITLVIPVWLSAQVISDDSLIQNILVNGKPSKVENNTITLRSSDNLTILFSTSPNTSSYFYKLENKDKEHRQDVNPLAVYSSLRRGTYTFQAYTEPRQAAKEVQSLKVVVKNSFMDNWWFVPLLVLYLLLLFGGASYFILLSNFRNKEKVYDLRSSWTNKLHNDIGGDLSSVSIRIEVLKKRLSDIDPKMMENLTKTYAVLKAIQKKLRFVFDLVDPGKNSLFVMFAEVEDFAQENYTLKHIRLDYQNNLKPTEEFKIDIGRINKLYLVMKEVVNNTMKYSEASLATISIQRMKKGMQIEMTDNGKGFDKNAAHKGNGIKSLQKYAQEGFLDIQIQSEIGKGTTITIQVPEL